MMRARRGNATSTVADTDQLMEQQRGTLSLGTKDKSIWVHPPHAYQLHSKASTPPRPRRGTLDPVRKGTGFEGLWSRIASSACSLSYRTARFGKILNGDAEDNAVIYKPSDQSSNSQPYPESVPTAAEV